jgi:hypothetical protein
MAVGFSISIAVMPVTYRTKPSLVWHLLQDALFSPRVPPEACTEFSHCFSAARTAVFWSLWQVKQEVSATTWLMILSLVQAESMANANTSAMTPKTNNFLISSSSRRYLIFSVCLTYSFYNLLSF